MATQRNEASGNGTKKSRLQFIIGAVIVLVLAATFASITMWALSIRSKTSSEFAKYVLSHHIGQAVVTDDASGFQTDFCVLHLDQPIPDNALKARAMGLFETYHQLDGGEHLTLEYAAEGGKAVIEADVVLIDSTHAALTLHLSTGVVSSVETLSTAS
ncbi:hypothetical protein [Alicyclobacillus ferrooxydans]|uniref:Uncharacterized protein n=1 Tax=Alicyclobacillus ferrooxydans TaxID=471514 RepID=A0A0P9CZP9_9BACL|nr:hypothetical protein [Alicyclobacillus ferrooxydans]KPV42599.1 hypothetical protein AN477_16565 [Alicyclobacillus ferrooxydans]